MSFFFPRRATESLEDSIAATGAHGGTYDPIDAETGWRKVGESNREVPRWTLDKARTYSVHAYRANPMARAILDTYTSFCVGDSGIDAEAHNPEVDAVVREFWSDPRNALHSQQEALLRSHLLMGETGIEPLVTPSSGRVRLSIFDVDRVQAVRLRNGNPLWPDELVFGTAGLDERTLKLVWPHDLTGLREGEAFFFADWKALITDRRGTPFLSPVMDWLQAYDDVLWNLADRTKLLRYFVWDVTIDGGPDDIEKFITDRGGRHAPPSGSLEVHNQAVDWKAQSPQVGAYEDRVTAASLLTSVAAGSGLAKTWLAEPEDANRATSLTMAEPVRRRVRGVQKVWVEHMRELTAFAVDRAVAAGRIPATVTIKGEGDTEREVPACDTIHITRPEIAASDSKVNAEILVNLSTAIMGLAGQKALAPKAARTLVRKAWEDFMGVPYRPELDDALDVDATADYLEEEEDNRRQRLGAVS